MAVPGLRWLGLFVMHDVAWLLEEITAFFSEQRALGWQSWLLWLCILAGVLLVLGGIRSRARVLLLVAGAAGPLLLLALYLLGCVYAITSPVNVDRWGLGEAVALLPVTKSPAGTPCGSKATLSPQQAAVETLVGELVDAKGIVPGNDQIQWQRTRADDPLVLVRCAPSAPAWRRLLTTRGNPALSIRFETAWLSRIGDTEKEQPITIINELSLLRGNAEWWLYLGGLLLWFYNYLSVSVSRISMHPFYRDRLSRTFLFRTDGDEVVSADDTKMSELAGVDSRAPYHLINTALNLQGSTEPTLRERKTVPMVLAPRFCGSDHTGYCSTATLEARDSHFDLGTAMAISAAAAARNMGALRFRGLTFIMALLNIRLNYWLPHPANVQCRPWRFLDLSGQVGLGYLLDEALGRADDRSEFVNCSDGGHRENLGVYELLKRRCRVIVCVDGEQDPDHQFHSLVTLQRYAEIDFGIRIDIDLSGISPTKNELSKAHLLFIV